MSKELKSKYKTSEEDLLISKIKDKIKFTKTKNKITHTDFLNTVEKSKVEKFLKIENYNRYFSFGGNENSERVIYVFYPDKIDEEMSRNAITNILEVIKIENTKNEKYEHRIYLGAIMKLGLKRERIGDIIVKEDGSDIVVFKENSEYIVNGLKQLTRFRNSKIYIDDIENLANKEIEFEDISIIVSSIRLDCFVSELANCSRNKAEEYIEFGKVFINSIEELKISKKLQVGDIITIRGKGKYIYDRILKETSKNRLVVNLRKYK